MTLAPRISCHLSSMILFANACSVANPGQLLSTQVSTIPYQCKACGIQVVQRRFPGRPSVFPHPFAQPPAYGLS